VKPDRDYDRQKDRPENSKEQGAGRDVERSLHISINSKSRPALQQGSSARRNYLAEPTSAYLSIN
jgi:hypothetical protein